MPPLNWEASGYDDDPCASAVESGSEWNHWCGKKDKPSSGWCCESYVSTFGSKVVGGKVSKH